MHLESRSPEVKNCIQSCKECHAVCVDTAENCLAVGGQHVATKHMRLLLDCAQICAASEDFMLRNSEFFAELCNVCADVCDVCAAACNRFSGDQQMQACVTACQSCADACRKMAAAQPARATPAAHAAHGAHAPRSGSTTGLSGALPPPGRAR